VAVTEIIMVWNCEELCCHNTVLVIFWPNLCFLGRISTRATGGIFCEANSSNFFPPHKKSQSTSQAW
jgi:hypothetical protein